MPREISTDFALLAPWMTVQLGRPVERGTLIGTLSDGVPTAVIWYETIFGSTVVAHMAVAAASRFLPREFLWYIFYYPFRQLHASRILAPISPSNPAAQRIVIHLGFTLEATLSPSQESPTIYFSMVEAQCRWLSLKEPQHGRRSKSSHGYNLRAGKSPESA